VVVFDPTNDTHWIYLNGVPKEIIDSYVWNQINRAFYQPITNEDSQAGYIPTQILAEKIKQDGYDGIIYSSCLETGYNIALFNLDSADLKSCCLYRVTHIEVTAEQAENPYHVTTEK
jgi:hypothetical protein